MHSVVGACKFRQGRIAAYCLVKALLASSVLVSFADAKAAAPAAVEGRWYVTGSVGALQRSDVSFSTFFGGTSDPDHDTDTFNAGPVGNLGIGYRLPWGFRIEGEAGYATYTTASISPLSTNGALPQFKGSRLDLQSGGEHDLTTFTANAFFDLPLHGPFVPYFGAGFGVAHTLEENGHFAGAGLSNVTQSGVSTTRPVVLGEVGLTIRATERWDVVPAYRFEHIFQSNTYELNIFKIGVRYSF